MRGWTVKQKHGNKKVQASYKLQFRKTLKTPHPCKQIRLVQIGTWLTRCALSPALCPGRVEHTQA